MNDCPGLLVLYPPVLVCLYLSSMLILWGQFYNRNFYGLDFQSLLNWSDVSENSRVRSSEKSVLHKSNENKSCSTIKVLAKMVRVNFFITLEINQRLVTIQGVPFFFFKLNFSKNSFMTFWTWPPPTPLIPSSA